MIQNRGRTITTALGFLPLFCHAQNLVPNPGFELVNNCSVNTLEESMQSSVLNWFTYDYANNSPDIYNTCYPGPSLSPPDTFGGFSMPNTGNAMCGLAYYPTPDHIEAVSVKLTDTLLTDSAYCASFFIKNSYYGEQLYYSANLGAYFSPEIIDHADIRNNCPHISAENTASEDDWKNVSGYYIASGNETYINIGYFVKHPDYHHPLPYPADFIYYFIDDISVTPCNKDSLLAVRLELPNVFTPNGDTSNAVYSVQHHNLQSLHIRIFNRWGNLIREYNGLTEAWDGRDPQGNELPEGVYFIKAVAETRFGETFSRQQFVHLFR